MTIRVGFLGAGLIATYHSKSLRGSVADVTWSGVYDPDRERAERFAAAAQTVVCDHADAVLDGCDAAYVCTWTSEHPKLVSAAVSRGRAVFCEKPLGVNLDAAQAMAAEVAASGVVNQVGLVLRASPAFAWMRSLVEHPDSGRVMSIVFRDDQYLPVQGMYGSSWRGDPALAGSGTLLEHSIHDVDMLEYLAGPVASVSARTAFFHGIDGIEDAVAASFTFAGGAVGSLVSVWHDVLERPSLRRVEVLCERLWCSLDDSDWWGPVRWVRAGGPVEELGGSELVSRVADAGVVPANPDAAFIEAVAADRPAFPDFGVALRAHQVVDAAYRSAAGGGRPVDVG